MDWSYKIEKATGITFDKMAVFTKGKKRYTFRFDSDDFAEIDSLLDTCKKILEVQMIYVCHLHGASKADYDGCVKCQAEGIELFGSFEFEKVPENKRLLKDLERDMDNRIMGITQKNRWKRKNEE